MRSPQLEQQDAPGDVAEDRQRARESVTLAAAVEIGAHGRLQSQPPAPGALEQALAGKAAELGIVIHPAGSERRTELRALADAIRKQPFAPRKCAQEILVLAIAQQPVARRAVSQFGDAPVEVRR